MQYYSGENICGNIGYDMLRGGITLALLSGGVKLLVGVMMLNSELVIYRRANNTGKQKQQSTHGNRAMHTKMMI